MLRDRSAAPTSEFLSYLATHPEADNPLPALARLSRELGISLAALREQLEVARALGLVDVRPGTGVRRRPYSFGPAVRQSLRYALSLHGDHFQKYSELRNHVEMAYWEEAAEKLTSPDKQELSELIARAEAKLLGTPVQVPHEEHRRLHILIYSRLNNPFVTGLLEAYWDAYEAVGLNLYSGDLEYLHEVWQYHASMVRAILDGDYQAGRQALVKHVELLAHRRS
jgi:DNA-binding FadR family transcriptional regulator